jgi:hypothetical protein
MAISVAMPKTILQIFINLISCILLASLARLV